MCGIIGTIAREDVVPKLMEGLRRLEYRGYDSAGLAIIRDNKYLSCKRVGRIDELRANLTEEFTGSIGIAHTRWATHGQPSQNNAHPHFDCKEEIAIVHNGIIENFAPLREYLEKQGHTFRSETDSEVIAHLIEENYEDNFFRAVQRSLAMLDGAYGVLILNLKDPNRLIAARNGSPLVIGIGDQEYYAASDVSAFLAYTRQVVHIDDGEIVEIFHNGTRTSTLTDQTVIKEIEEIDWQIDEIEKGGHPHFMLKEIFEQPEAMEDVLRGRLLEKECDARLRGLDEVNGKLRQLERIIITACGTAWHAGLIGEYIIEEKARIPVEVEYASEFRYRNPILTAEDLVIAVSQSGETADTLAAVREAGTKGAKTLGVVNVVGSTISREVDAGVYTHAGPEIGVASTKAFTTQMGAMALIALRLGRLRSLSLEEGRDIIEGLRGLPDKMKLVLEKSDEIRSIAEEYADKRNFLYLGRGYNFPIALEGALKLKEISYIHAEGYPAAEMKHGPIALIDEDMPVVVVAPHDDVYSKVLSNLQEIRARNGKVIAIASEGDEEIHEYASHVIHVPETLSFLSPFLTVIPCQLLAYHIAVLRGCDVDKPRNLAKSVTVE
jgi:glucosamine--fructose-6-phosphate aminotransferase (isomerizing)